jgi:ribosomal protein S27AE
MHKCPVCGNGEFIRRHDSVSSWWSCQRCGSMEERDTLMPPPAHVDPRAEPEEIAPPGPSPERPRRTQPSSPSSIRVSDILSEARKQAGLPPEED